MVVLSISKKLNDELRDELRKRGAEDKSGKLEQEKQFFPWKIWSSSNGEWSLCASSASECAGVRCRLWNFTISRFKNKRKETEKPAREKDSIVWWGKSWSWDKQVVSVWWLLRIIITRRFFGFGLFEKQKRKTWKSKKMPNYEVVTTVTTIEGAKPQVGRFENDLSKFWGCAAVSECVRKDSCARLSWKRRKICWCWLWRQKTEARWRWPRESAEFLTRFLQNMPELLQILQEVYKIAKYLTSSRQPYKSYNFTRFLTKLFLILKKCLKKSQNFQEISMQFSFILFIWTKSRFCLLRQRNKIELKSRLWSRARPSKWRQLSELKLGERKMFDGFFGKQKNHLITASE